MKQKITVITGDEGAENFKLTYKGKEVFCCAVQVMIDIDTKDFVYVDENVPSKRRRKKR